MTRISDELASSVDRLVAEGHVASRSEAVRVALEELVDHYRRVEIGRRIVEGYTATPQTEAELAAVDAAARAMIAEEPW